MAEVSKETISQVMGVIGSIKTEKKTERSRANLETARAARWEGENREKSVIAQRERRQRERAEKEAAASLLPPTEKKRPGRPAKQTAAAPTDPTALETGPKRGRGRPRKDSAAPATPEAQD